MDRKQKAPLDLHATTVAIVGHPFSSIGMGEQMRAGFAAVSAMGIKAKYYDVFRYAERSDLDFCQAVLPNEIDDLNQHPIRIFHINGDEVDPVLAVLRARGVDFASGHNIIVPVWELPKYPSIWKQKLALFDAVWAPSRFVKTAFDSAGIRSHHVGQAVEKRYPTLFGRRYFGIRESAFVLLHFFDTKSYPRRKNPEAVLDLYRRVRQARPYDDIQLVLKMRAGDTAIENAETIVDAAIPRDVRVIASNLTSHEAFSLLSAADCFVSLHRAEGFGRGLSEAMWLGRIALGTGWSGNLDYMNSHNSLMVNHEMRDLLANDYPYAAGQQWAEPDVDHAEFLLTSVLDDPSLAAGITARARVSAMLECSNRAVGLRMAVGLATPTRGRPSSLTGRRRRDTRRTLETVP